MLGKFGLLAAALALFALPAQADPVVASVNGEEIRVSDLEQAKKRLPERLQGYPLDAIRDLLIDSLVDTKVAAAEARKQGLGDAPDVKAQLAQIEDLVLERALIARHVKKSLTEARLRQGYQEMLRNARNEDEIHARHILVDTRGEARDIIKKAQNGADFGELARKHSTGPSGKNGGDLGFFKREEMVPAFAKAAFALSPGAISQSPVQTQFGWHVIKVEETRKARPPSFEEARPRLERELSEKLSEDYMRSLRAKAKVKKFK